jgi:hypothetical protein
MGRVLSRQDLIVAVAADRRAGKTIAFANGCFDFLRGASALGLPYAVARSRFRARIRSGSFAALTRTAARRAPLGA